MYDINDSPLILNWCPYRGKLTLLPRLFVMILLVYAANFLGALPGTITMVALDWDGFATILLNFANGAIGEAEYNFAMGNFIAKTTAHPAYLLMTLIGTVFTILAILLYTFKVEGRTKASFGIGLNRRTSLWYYLSGLGIGGGMLLLAVAIAALFGTIDVQFVGDGFGWILLFFFGFVIQAASEEFLLRGFLMTSFLRPGRSPWVGIILSTVFFTLLHTGNSGVSVIAILNIALFGLFLATLAVRTGNLWAACGLHAMWNFMQGNLFGISVSGMPVMPTVWGSSYSSADTLWNGGAFGLEGGLIATAILVLALALVFFLPSWKRNRPEPIFAFFQ